MHAENSGPNRFCKFWEQGECWLRNYCSCMSDNSKAGIKFRDVCWRTNSAWWNGEVVLSSGTVLPSACAPSWTAEASEGLVAVLAKGQPKLVCLSTGLPGLSSRTASIYWTEQSKIVCILKCGHMPFFILLSFLLCSRGYFLSSDM